MFIYFAKIPYQSFKHNAEISNNCIIVLTTCQNNDMLLLVTRCQNKRSDLFYEKKY